MGAGRPRRGQVPGARLSARLQARRAGPKAGHSGGPLRRSQAALRLSLLPARGEVLRAQQLGGAHPRKRAGGLRQPFTNASAHNFQMMTFLLGQDPSHLLRRDGRRGRALSRQSPRRKLRHRRAALPYVGRRADSLLHRPSVKGRPGPCGVFEFEKGTVTFDSDQPSFKAVLRDGSRVDYTVIDPGHPLQKLYDALDCVKNGGAPSAGWRRTSPTSAPCAWCRSSPSARYAKSCATPSRRTATRSSASAALKRPSSRAPAPGPYPPRPGFGFDKRRSSPKRPAFPKNGNAGRLRQSSIFSSIMVLRYCLGVLP